MNNIIPEHKFITYKNKNTTELKQLTKSDKDREPITVPYHNPSNSKEQETIVNDDCIVLIQQEQKHKIDKQQDSGNINEYIVYDKNGRIIRK